MTLMPLKGGGSFKEGKSRQAHYGFDSASLRCGAGWKEAARFGGGAVGLIRCRSSTMIGGAHLSTRCGEGQMQLSAGALSCSGGRNRAWHR
jgi:hypothetical protein